MRKLCTITSSWGVQKSIIMDVMFGLEKSVTGEHCLASLGKSLDANQ